VWWEGGIDGGVTLSESAEIFLTAGERITTESRYFYRM
jgi:hypothetical protein